MASNVVVPDLSHGHLQILPWSDPDLEHTGHDPRSAYVEQFWLSVLGPSAVWLLRHFVRRLDDEPDGTWIEVEPTALAIGLASARHSTTVFARTVERLIRFNAARTVNGHTLEVRTRLAPITRRQAERMPIELQRALRDWHAQHAPVDRGRRPVSPRPPAATAS